LPDIESSFYQKYADDGLRVIAIDANALDVGDVAGLTEYVNWLGVSYPVATEAAGEGTYGLFNALYEGSNPFPIDIIIDKEGTIRYIAREYDPIAMDAVIQELLAE
jgi:hypothetical protein